MIVDVQDIKDKLHMLGYTVTADDEVVIRFAISKILRDIKNFCQRSDIPNVLYYVVVDKVAGEFLKAKKASGQLEGFSVDLNAVMLSKWSQGDTSLSYAVDKTKSKEERLDALIEALTDIDKKLLPFRRFRLWI